jgi:hypothetical protein
MQLNLAKKVATENGAINPPHALALLSSPQIVSTRSAWKKTSIRGLIPLTVKGWLIQGGVANGRNTV